MPTFRLPAILGLLVLSRLVAAEPAKPPYLDSAAPLEVRVEDLLGRLTLEEKLSLVHGDAKFTTPAIPRLGIPVRWMSDGPHGVREEIKRDTFQPAGHTDDFSTAMPCGIALAATWNPELAQAEGEAIGEEARARGKDIMLGPGVNIMRTPLCGRNFEYLGEDPYLASRLAVAYIRGEQSRDVAACVKHFAANNQETQRGSIDVEMDERTLREIYLPAFRAAVQEAGVWALMGAYNQFRGEHCCHNDYLLNQVLKQEWGFRGLVMSDWNGTHDTRQAALNGLDLEMGTERGYDDYFLADPYRQALQRGELPLAGLDEKVRRNLRVMIATHVFDERAPGSINTRDHQVTARHVAEEAIVLLKNAAGTLPLNPAKLKSIAVIGENATRAQAHGGQSSELKALYEVTPLEGILRRAGRGVSILYAQGYEAPNTDKLSPRTKTAEKPLPPAELADRAVAVARQADVVIYVGGLNHEPGEDCESRDRADLALPYGQDELLARIVAANPRTVVVLVAGSPVAMGPWLERSPALVQAWYGGSEAGNALARVLFGDVNPSGKLPCTFPKTLTDSPAHALGAFPGHDGVVRYEEGLLVGYRWFDTKKIEPQFPFGFGLSYTSFRYSDVKVMPADGVDVAKVEVTLENTGARAGADVVQVYVRDVQSSLPRPLQELKAFRKVELGRGEKTTVTLLLPPQAFGFYDPARKAWVAEAGKFAIAVGNSSRDIQGEAEFELKRELTWK